MIFLGKFKELCPNHNFPSMKDCINDGQYEGKNQIVEYLKNGKVDMVRMETPRDVFTGDKIDIEMLGMNDGEYTWFNTLAYYVEKYNLRLPKDFTDKVIGCSR